MIEKRAVLWDLDGVLMDTYELHYRSWVFAFGEVGVSFSLEQFQPTFGVNNRATILKMLGEERGMKLADQIDQHKEQWFRDHIAGNVPLFPGVLEWLKRFKEWGFPQAVASSGQQATIDAQVDGVGIRPYFDAVVSGSQLPPKPNPDVFLLAAKTVRMPIEKCLVIEDSLAGATAGVRAGAKVLAVETTLPGSALTIANQVVYRLDRFTPQDAAELLGLRL